MDLSQPWMSREEIELAACFLGPSNTVLEWGAGGSTLFFSPTVGLWHVVEHNRTWAAQISTEIEFRGLQHTHLHSVPIVARAHYRGPYPRGYEEEWEGYVQYPRTLDVTFDAVLVDGRARLFCALEAVNNLLAPTGVLLFHDFFAPGRERYHAILDRCKVIAKVTSGQTLAILRPKKADEVRRDDKEE